MTKKQKTHDLRIEDRELLQTVEEIRNLLPLSENGKKTVLTGRKNIITSLRKQKAPLIVFLGPCAIHDVKLALDYADRVAKLQRRIDQYYGGIIRLYMRYYVEKPRTGEGWPGFLLDPDLDGSFSPDGIYRTRELAITPSVGRPV